MPRTDQYIQYTYPISQDNGGAEIHMFWSDKTCYTVCWNEGYKWIDAYRSPNLEFIVFEHMWLENDAWYGDLLSRLILHLRKRILELLEVHSLEFT
jgi:trimethylamine-N-oxide reductase (cytochrome c)